MRTTILPIRVRDWWISHVGWWKWPKRYCMVQILHTQRILLNGRAWVNGDKLNDLISAHFVDHLIIIPTLYSVWRRIDLVQLGFQLRQEGLKLHQPFEQLVWCTWRWPQDKGTRKAQGSKTNQGDASAQTIKFCLMLFRLGWRMGRKPIWRIQRGIHCVQVDGGASHQEMLISSDLFVPYTASLNSLWFKFNWAANLGIRWNIWARDITRRCTGIVRSLPGHEWIKPASQCGRLGVYLIIVLRSVNVCRFLYKIRFHAFRFENLELLSVLNDGDDLRPDQLFALLTRIKLSMSQQHTEHSCRFNVLQQRKSQRSVGLLGAVNQQKVPQLQQARYFILLASESAGPKMQHCDTELSCDSCPPNLCFVAVCCSFFSMVVRWNTLIVAMRLSI